MNKPTALALLFLIAAEIFACRSVPQEEKLRQWLEQAITEAEQGNYSGLLDRLGDDFVVRPGGLGKKELSHRMLYVVSHTHGAKIYHPRAQISLSEDEKEAELSFPFLLLRGETAEPARDKDAAEWLAGLAEKSRLMRLTVWLRREGGDWKAHQAMLEQFTGVGFKPLRQYY